MRRASPAWRLRTPPARRLRAYSAGAFSPASLPGLALWLTAGPAYCYTDAGTTPAGDTDTIGQWNDRSVNGRNASQSTLANKPILYSLGGGLWCVTGDGVDDFLATAAFAFEDSYSAVAVVARPWTASKYAAVFGHNYSTSTGAGLLTAGGANGWADKDLIAFGDGYSQDPKVYGPSGGYADASMHVVAVTLGATEARLRVDGASIATTTGTAAGDTAADALRLFGSSAALGDYGDWDLSELLIFSPALTLAQLQEVEDYLNGIYGVY